MNLTPIMLFLGAGASKPFGIPTMGEMVDKFEKKLGSMNGGIDKVTRETMTVIYRTIKERQVKSYGYADLESVFSVIQLLANNPPYKELGHAPAHILSQFVDIKNRVANEHDSKAAQELVKQMKIFVKESCQLKGSAIQQIEETYGKLFHNFASIGSVESTTVEGKDYYRGDWRIYTTNYDLALESYWSGAFEINDCFKPSAGVNIMDVSQASNNGHKLIKLHGSIDWYRLKNKGVVKSETSRDRMGKREVEGELMIYPIQKKDLYLDPWIHLFAALKRDLMQCNILLVIGYRFNDAFIREIFVEALEKRKLNGNQPIVEPSSSFHYVESKYFPRFSVAIFGYVRGIRGAEDF